MLFIWNDDPVVNVASAGLSSVSKAPRDISDIISCLSQIKLFFMFNQK